MKYIIDSYAWIEYLEGGKLGEKVREIIIGDDEIISLSVVVAEVVSKVKRKNGNVDIAYNAINSNSNIVELTSEAAKKAGLLHAETRKNIENFGLVDAMLLVLARDIKAKILTGDNHLKDFKEVIFLK